HIMFGDISAWMIRQIAGINADEEHPGFKRVVLRPQLLEKLAWAKAWHEGPYGRIECGWKRVDNGVQITGTIPPNSTGLLHLPGGRSETLASGAFCFVV
ncbi:MAG: alpha-L-rhamnosidase C-terminal domain-containing protein, partial [Phycisphaerae bacterium]